MNKKESLTVEMSAQNMALNIAQDFQEWLKLQQIDPEDVVQVQFEFKNRALTVNTKRDPDSP